MKSLIVADIHANLAAFEAILDREGSWDTFIFLGDAVMAGPNPDEVLSLLLSLNGIYIMGNHDQEVLELDPDADVTNLHRKWAQWHQKNISRANLDFLAEFQDSCAVENQGLTMKLTHGCIPREMGRRLWPDSSAETFAFLASQHSEPYILVAHSHVQFRKTHHDKTFVNPGSAGAPYLGQPLACYAVIQDGHFALKATSYDAEKTCQTMEDRARGIMEEAFIEDWKECWRTGLLPDRYFIRDYTPLREQGYR
ncbi:metallophosphoesterase family protein [Candidatus Poribacteria bacterium]